MRGARTSAIRTVVRRAGLYHGVIARQPLPRQFDALPPEDLAGAIVHEKVSSLLLRRLQEDRPELVERLDRQRVYAEARARITVLTRGQILAEGDYQTVSADPAVREAYLGTGHA